MPTSRRVNTDSSFDVNRRCVIAFRMIGKGRSAAARFASYMNMPPPQHSSTWTSHVNKIADAAFVAAEAELLSASSISRKATHSEETALSDSDIVNVSVSIDGSWSTRGLSAKHGYAAAISTYTGLILDRHYTCNSCKTCKQYETCDENSPQYADYIENHLPVCQQNFNGLRRLWKQKAFL